VLGVLVDEMADPILDEIYQRVSGETLDFAEVAYREKRRVMNDLFPGEVSALALRLGQLGAYDRHARDLTLPELEEALVQVTASFPVYRTYIRDYAVSDRDRAHIEQAVAAATTRHPDDAPARDFLRRVLLLEATRNLADEQRMEHLRFIMRWQQFTGPIAAKGVEDTALYVYNRLLALNEVGSEPRMNGPQGVPSADSRGPNAEHAARGSPSEVSSGERGAWNGGAVARFHGWNQGRGAQWPHTLNGTSTHDTKRSEDVRARLAVLSELAEAWGERLERWRAWNRPLQPVVAGELVPSGNGELLLYQTLLGAWPLRSEELPTFRERLHAYLEKASREAKEHTSWLRPNAEYEEAVTRFADAILEQRADNQFLPDFLELQGVTAYYGALNALSQVVLKLGAPGVPDFYQGTELWDLSLVDPDNRRPVDFQARAAWLAELEDRGRGDRQSLSHELFEHWSDGRIKLYVTHLGLLLRRAHADLFADGEYVPLEIVGDRLAHVCAFARRLRERWVLLVAPRLCARLAATIEASGEHPARSAERQPAGGLRTDVARTPSSIQLPALRAPVGTAIWADTRLMLPEGAPGRWRNVFTGVVVASAATVQDARPAVLALGSALREFPVAMLVGELDDPGD
jgi:(1->4)-alpha-D-glucan 1-alpha-D-glucosylmutase